MIKPAIRQLNPNYFLRTEPLPAPKGNLFYMDYKVGNHGLCNTGSTSSVTYDGNTLTDYSSGLDFAPEEKERGITLTSNATYISVADVLKNNKDE